MWYGPIARKALSDDELQCIRRQLVQLEFCVGQMKLALGPDAQSRLSITGPDVDEARIRRLLKARRLRESRLGINFFADPAWDIVLEVFAATLGGQRISVSGVCQAGSVPDTTALRWVKKLEQEGWFVRRADPTDARRFWIELSAEAFVKLQSFFEGIWPAPGAG